MKKPPPKRHSLLLFGVLCIGLLLFILLFLIQSKSRVNISVPQTVMPTPTTEASTPGQAIVKRPTNTPPPKKAQYMQPTRVPTQPVASSSGKTTSPLRNNTDGITTLGVCTNVNAPCVLSAGDELFRVLGQEAKNTKLYVGGSWVTPKKITYLLTQETYSEHTLADASGKTLVSSQVVYTASSQTLTIRVGMLPSYYSALSPASRKSLYLEQTVRTGLALLNENPNNFVKAQQAVSQLSAWNPKP